MALVTTIDNASQFRDLFHQCGRASQFSYDALSIIFDRLSEISDCDKEHIVIDVVGLCCEYAEDSPEKIAEYYDVPIDGLSESDIAEQVRNFLEEAGEYVGTTDHGLIVYRQF